MKICWRKDRLPTPVFLGFPCGSAGKESTCNAGDLGSIAGLGIFPGEGQDYILQYSGLENSMDCTGHGVTKSQTWLRDFHFHFQGMKIPQASGAAKQIYKIHISLQQLTETFRSVCSQDWNLTEGDLQWSECLGPILNSCIEIITPKWGLWEVIKHNSGAHINGLYCCSIAKLCLTFLCTLIRRPYGLQHARLLCPSLSPGVCSYSCLLSLWHSLTIPSSAASFSFCLSLS